MTSKNSPDFFIVGAPRSGTTSLHEYFKKIPEIFMCPKECGYFSKYCIGRVETLQEYQKLFQNSTNKQLIGDATAIYLRDPETPKLIHDANPNAKIIILLRDPIERAYSHYLMFIKNEYETKSFSKQIRDYSNNGIKTGMFHDYIIMPSLYSNSVLKYVEIFGIKNVGVFLYEDFAKNTQKIVSEILEFLEIKTKLPENVGNIYNEYAKPLGETSKSIISNQTIKTLAKRFLTKSTRVSLTRSVLTKKGEKPTINIDDEKILHDLFIDDVKKLQKILKKKINWNHFPEV